MAKVSYSKPESKFIRIKEYAYASINLYGVIKLDDFISVFNHYESSPITKEEVIPVLELLDSIDEIDLSFRESILGNGYFLLEDSRDFKEAKALLKQQSDKPRYLPEKAEFLRYMDPEYVEPIKPLMDLEAFFIDQKMNPKRSAEDVKFDVLELHDEIVFGERLTQFVEYLEQSGYIFKDDVQIKMFGDLVKDMHNQTRMYENKGFTPSELRELMEPSNGFVQ